MVCISDWSGRPLRLAMPLVAGLAVAPHPAWAQAMSCPTIAADVQAEQPTGLPTVSGQDQESLDGHTSEQLIQQWATAQDPSSDACRVLTAVQHRLAAEDAFARGQCPDVLPALQRQADLAAGEVKILCRRRK